MGFSQSVFPFVHFDLIYLSDKHTGQISMVLIPKDMQHCYETRRTTLDIPELKRNALPCLGGRQSVSPFIVPSGPIQWSWRYIVGWFLYPANEIPRSNCFAYGRMYRDSDNSSLR